VQTTLRSGAAAIAAITTSAVLLISGAAPALGPGTVPARPAAVTAVRTSIAVRLSPLGTAHVRPGASTVNSLNSAGYAVSRARTRFRYAAATFFVPYLNCRLSPGAYSAGWVGLDGSVGTPPACTTTGARPGSR
jgi:hypothetical protein